MKTLLKNSMLLTFLLAMLVGPIAFVGTVKYKNEDLSAKAKSVLSVTDDRTDANSEIPENMPQEIRDIIMNLEKEMQEESTQSTQSRE